MSHSLDGIFDEKSVISCNIACNILSKKQGGGGGGGGGRPPSIPCASGKRTYNLVPYYQEAACGVPRVGLGNG